MGPEVGNAAPLGHAMITIATAITKCNEWLTMCVHTRRPVAIA